MYIQNKQGFSPLLPSGDKLLEQKMLCDIQNKHFRSRPQYLGRWYEIQRFEAPFQTGDCVTADYALLPNCSISVTNSNILP